ncbi:hypothetical protein NDU88_003358 [Pleurodeles waltl]|uniref:Uncharacterized protein n=1 Tax=Pleurodeles waltl TaxID=8319 RepID=A0AAV7VHM4_PLEWA|nr:hypothetical protein NDU88_003358 [Pleurodeles waltl]
MCYWVSCLLTYERARDSTECRVQAALTESSEKKHKGDDDDEELYTSPKGKYVQGNVFSDILAYIQDVLGFEPKSLVVDGFYSH